MRVLALICLAVITFGSYRVGKTVADTYWRSKVQDAIEETREQMTLTPMTASAGTAWIGPAEMGWSCTGCSTSMTSATSGTAGTIGVVSSTVGVVGGTGWVTCGVHP
jgi:hypothetical protein